ncbi:MAG TPA: MFS transporter, partial [Acidobacteriaceae bacterium]|nr:MFS transporter [Acidobacteriaceae bacterium]
MAFVDRVNVAMILPYVDKGLALSADDIGFAAGIFFVGYMLLQIPGGLLASRWSARKTVAILMVLWSLPAIASGLVQTRTELYMARFLLGLFAGGVWPAVLVLLMTWFPQKERARANALWMTCLPLSAILMTPLTGAMLTVLSWRWVFILQGLPPLIWVVVWWLLIADRPSQAKWISGEERTFIEESAAAEARSKPPSAGYWAAFTNPTVLWLILAYFFWMAGFYGLTMWVPSVVKSFTGSGSSWNVGWLSAIPFVFALVGMVVNSAWSDRRMKRQLHVSIPLALGAVGLIGGQWVGDGPIAQMVFLIVAAIGIYSPYGPFWATPTALLQREVSGAAMGLINAIGNLGGFLGPFLVGWIRTDSHNGFAGFMVLSIFLLISAV